MFFTRLYCINFANCSFIYFVMLNLIIYHVFILLFESFSHHWSFSGNNSPQVSGTLYYYLFIYLSIYSSTFFCLLFIYLINFLKSLAFRQLWRNLFPCQHLDTSFDHLYIYIYIYIYKSHDVILKTNADLLIKCPTFSPYVYFPHVFILTSIVDLTSLLSPHPILMMVHLSRNSIVSTFFSINFSFCLDYLIIIFFSILSDFIQLFTFIYIFFINDIKHTL